MIILNRFYFLVVSEEQPHGFEDKWILQNSIISKVVIRGILVDLIIIQPITQTVYWETSTYPSEEDIVWDPFLWRLILEICISRNLILHVSVITFDVLVVTTACSKCTSLRLNDL